MIIAVSKRLRKKAGIERVVSAAETAVLDGFESVNRDVPKNLNLTLNRGDSSRGGFYNQENNQVVVFVPKKGNGYDNCVAELVADRTSHETLHAIRGEEGVLDFRTLDGRTVEEGFAVHFQQFMANGTGRTFTAPQPPTNRVGQTVLYKPDSAWQKIDEYAEVSHGHLKTLFYPIYYVGFTALQKLFPEGIPVNSEDFLLPQTEVRARIQG